MEPWAGSPREPRAWQREAFPVVLAALRARKAAVISAIMGAGKSVLLSEIVHYALPGSVGRACVVVAPKQDLVRQLAGTMAERCGADRVGMFFADSKEWRAPVVVACGASLPALHEALSGAGKKTALMVVDEAHGSEGSRLKETIPLFGAPARLACTATPFRSVPRESLSLWDKVVYRYTMADALRDQVLVPMRHVRYRGEAPGSVDEECLAMIREDGRGPGIVSAYSIQDAEDFAEWLTGQGVPAMPIHSGMNGWERARRLEILRDGGIRCLVHVALLSEGVDLPWLRWLCLRRRVQARVRFLQEIGRVLRVCAGKAEGVVMDPHLLLGRHGLVTAEAIGLALEEAAAVGEVEVEETDERGLTEAQVVALDELVEYLARVHSGLLASHLIKPREIVAPFGWEILGVSEKQVAAIGRVKRFTGHIASEAREPIKALAQVPWALSRGQAGQLLDVLIASQEWAKAQTEASQKRSRVDGHRPKPSFLRAWPYHRAGKPTVPEKRVVDVVGRLKPLDHGREGR